MKCLEFKEELIRFICDDDDDDDDDDDYDYDDYDAYDVLARSC